MRPHNPLGSFGMSYEQQFALKNKASGASAAPKTGSGWGDASTWTSIIGSIGTVLGGLFAGNANAGNANAGNAGGYYRYDNSGTPVFVPVQNGRDDRPDPDNTNTWLIVGGFLIVAMVGFMLLRKKKAI